MICSDWMEKIEILHVPAGSVVWWPTSSQCGGRYCLRVAELESKSLLMNVGRVIAQAVSRWLPTAAAWVQTRV
jgi:hypothetical protein